ncbi:MAG: antibiotic biosynthesis monooxygenase [Acidobacteria bacterium]|nr:antibiotic biosynthesis monooxygenase [Acidobacteriota bacterium]
MTQTSLFVKMVFQEGKRDEGVAALETMLPTVEAEEGTLVYSFHRQADDANTVWVFELYTDGDALGVHGGSEAMAALFGLLGPMLAEPPMMVMATPTPKSKGLPA